MFAFMASAFFLGGDRHAARRRNNIGLQADVPEAKQASGKRRDFPGTFLGKLV